MFYEIIGIIVLAIILVWVIKLLVKLTSLIVKAIVWFCLIILAVYMLNYYILPKFSRYTPLPIEEFISQKIKEKKITEKLSQKLKKTKNELKPKVEKFINEKVLQKNEI